MPSAPADPTTAGPWAAHAPTAGQYAEVNGLRLYYEIHGTGKPLVLLHGGLGAGSMLGPLLPALTAGRQVILPDLQGHGRTADVDRPLSVEHMADDVAALVRHLGLGRVDVMGYSLGGGVALLTAIRHPDVVDRLVVVSVAIRHDAYYPEIRAQQQMVNAGALEMMKRTPMYQLYAAVAPRPEDFPRLLDKIGAAMQVPYDFSEQIRGITARTLVVAGDSDMFPPSHAVETFALLGGGQRDGGWDGSGRPTAQLAILPHVTHYTIFADPLLAEVATRFLGGTS